MNAHEELVERCVDEAQRNTAPHIILGDVAVRAVLAEVFRTLQDVTPEMTNRMFHPHENKRMETSILEWLRASPLAPPALHPQSCTCYQCHGA